MDKITRRVSFRFEEQGMLRLVEQRIVSTVIDAVADGNRVGNNLGVVSRGNHTFRTEKHKISDWG